MVPIVIHSYPQGAHALGNMQGAEFEILDGLYKLNKLHLIDLLAYECHGWVHGPPSMPNCKEMTMLLDREHMVTLVEGKGYTGYDSYSTPSLYRPA
mmetsp:Transcript_20991/g.48184  ORF Transcript_20991/g.48184 Transcript_20991/m.48184 type:complete len:96 (+) Transcript_20991:1602-1889(+)